MPSCKLLYAKNASDGETALVVFWSFQLTPASITPAMAKYLQYFATYCFSSDFNVLNSFSLVELSSQMTVYAI